MELRIDRVVTREETYTADIAHGQTLCNDASLPEGTAQVLTEGLQAKLSQKIFAQRWDATERESPRRSYLLQSLAARLHLTEAWWILLSTALR